ncbi:hypothetical protein OG542_40180 (plasmid) [Streptomyces violaceus]|uniref:hypothetical protein n=1 Tax=Streptomyces violaceus TaxID=1936 RepID=UPI002E1CD0C0
MVDPRARRLRPPAGGQRVQITWKADIGAPSRPRDLACYLQDVDVAIGVGEQWGTTFARAAAQQELVERIARRGTKGLEGEALERGYSSRDIRYLDEWMRSRPLGPWRDLPLRSSGGMIESLADARVPKILGASTRVTRVEYGSPLLLDLANSGFLAYGVVKIAELVRDWSNRRRADTASARRIEAEAARGEAEARQEYARARHMEAQARQTEAHADLVQWAVDQTRGGPVSPGELFAVITPEQLQALSRLAETRTELQLPLDASVEE